MFDSFEITAIWALSIVMIVCLTCFTVYKIFETRYFTISGYCETTLPGINGPHWIKCEMK